MRSFIISENDSGQRLDKFITKAVPNLPQALMYKYIRLKRIKVNGGRSQISFRLSVGDKVDMYINDEFFTEKSKKHEFDSASRNIDIVYEDQNIVLLNKREGLLVHADGKEFRDTLILRLQRYLFENGEYDPETENSFAPALVNRIDRNTCGIVIAAKNAEALRILNSKLKDREITKKYMCLVHGVLRPKSGILTGYLEKNEEQNRVYIHETSREGSRSIRTGYTVISEKGNMSLLEIDLLTGRTHQIRAHMASIGHPLIGDGKYGKNASDKKQGFIHQALCSYKVSFDFRTPSGILEYLNGKSFQLDDIWFVKDFLSTR